MEFKILLEAGYDEAKYGMSLSYKDRSIKRKDWIPCTEDDFKYVVEDCSVDQRQDIGERIAKYDRVLQANAGRGGGHDKFLRQVVLWIDVEMPRYLWPELDQYKVSTVTQSESTVHTLMKRALRTSDCVPWTSQASIDAYNLGYPYNNLKAAKANLPEGYLQRRVLTCNYATLANIITQRTGHRVDDWQFIINSIYNQVEHPELLPPMPQYNTGGEADSKGDKTATPQSTEDGNRNEH